MHKHFLAFVKPDQGANPSENETNVRRKKPTKKKIKQEEAVFCFYCVLLLSLLCQEKPTGTNSCLFVVFIPSGSQTEPGRQQRVMDAKNA